MTRYKAGFTLITSGTSCVPVTSLMIYQCRFVHLQIDKGMTLLDCSHFVIAIVVTGIIMSPLKSRYEMTTNCVKQD